MRPNAAGWVDHLGWLLISTRGRIPRSIYWATKLGLALILIVVFAISARANASWWLLLSFILYMIALVSVAIKRLHDQEMSGLWVLVCFVPYLGELFSLIVLGC
jgi:uncharacterized membrane protein YhaH (DUF805 family)